MLIKIKISSKIVPKMAEESHQMPFPPHNSSLHFLDGLKVVELAGLAPVPFCALLLADFGASVTLVINRSGSVATFEQRLLRGKHQIWLDFKRPEELEKLRELCCTADVLLDPYRPGTLEGFGLEPEKLLEENPGLVIARLTGYGQTGPMAKRAGHDINFVALSGLLPTIAGKCHPNGPLWPSANLLADFAGGGLLAAFGILSALLRRAKNGCKGAILDCSLTEGVAYLGTFVSLYRDQSWLWDEEFAVFSGKCPIYRTYKTADAKWMAVGALEPKFQQILFETLGLDQQMPSDLGELAQKLELIFRGKSQAEWTAIFRDKDACVTPVLDMAEGEELASFEQHKARGTFQLVVEEGGTQRLAVPRAVPREQFLKEDLEMEKKRTKSKL